MDPDDKQGHRFPVKVRAAFEVLKCLRTEGTAGFPSLLGREQATARDALRKNNCPKTIAAGASPSLLEGLVESRGSLCL